MWLILRALHQQGVTSWSEVRLWWAQPEAKQQVAQLELQAHQVIAGTQSVEGFTRSASSSNAREDFKDVFQADATSYRTRGTTTGHRTSKSSKAASPGRKGKPARRWAHVLSPSGKVHALKPSTETPICRRHKDQAANAFREDIFILHSVADVMSTGRSSCRSCWLFLPEGEKANVSLHASVLMW